MQHQVTRENKIMKDSSQTRTQNNSELNPEDKVTLEAVEATTTIKDRIVEDPNPEADQSKDQNFIKDLTARTDQAKRKHVTDAAKPIMSKMVVGLKTHPA
jgi:hypothetical protein